MIVHLNPQKASGASRPGNGGNPVQDARWQIRYKTPSVQEYAKQLDSFGIELAAAGGSPTVEYASHLSRAEPTTRKGPAADERRCYMTWKEGKLRDFDAQLLRKAGISIEDQRSPRNVRR